MDNNKIDRYPGISPFSAEQRSVFFGRNTDIENLFHLVSIEQQVLLYAKSGLGKSSLINAGLVPLLQEHTQIVSLPVRLRGGQINGAYPKPVAKCACTTGRYFSR